VVKDKLGDSTEASMVSDALDILASQRDEFENLTKIDLSWKTKSHGLAMQVTKHSGTGKRSYQKLTEARCMDWEQLEAREREARE
jgi:hypothetical protein